MTKGIFGRKPNWNRVYYRASQVERSLLCYFKAGDIPKGLRVAVLAEREQFAEGSVPSQTFYTGTIAEISARKDWILVKYDKCRDVISLGGSLRNLALFIIPLEEPKLPKTRKRERGATAQGRG